MNHSGYVDWHTVMRTSPWVPCSEGQTFVYAFWLVDYGRNRRDHGVALLKPEGAHPDWFLHAERADHLLTAYLPEFCPASPSASEVFDARGLAKPMIGSILLGTASVIYASPSRSAFWSCQPEHLERRGQRIVKDLTTLYMREPLIVTFVDPHPMKETNPGAGQDQATVTPAPGS